MFRTLVALIGLAILGAIFAGIYYAPENIREQEGGEPAFRLAAGEVRMFAVQPSLEDSPILIEVEVFDGPVDVYVMDQEWARALVAQRDGTISLQRPFAYHAEHSQHNVTGLFRTAVVSDGETWLAVLVDNSDNYYDNDMPPSEQPSARITTRYVDEESRSLMLGYMAVMPSILLVVVTLGRQVRRWRKGIHPQSGEAP